MKPTTLLAYDINGDARCLDNAEPDMHYVPNEWPEESYVTPASFVFGTPEAAYAKAVALNGELAERYNAVLANIRFVKEQAK